MGRVGCLTMADVSNALGVSKRTLYRWEAKGVIPRAKRHPINRYRVYTKKDVQELAKILIPLRKVK